MYVPYATFALNCFEKVTLKLYILLELLSVCFESWHTVIVIVQWQDAEGENLIKFKANLE